MVVRAMPVMIGVLAVLAIAYRYYSAFLAARVAGLDDSRRTPAHEFNDGQNYLPTNKWVLFGHHFAAISGAGPLLGPVLALQFGYLPGLIWLVVGVCLAGAVQDMMVLFVSTRSGGKGLATIARNELGTVAGIAATIAILYVVVIALAGLGIAVVKALGGEEVPMAANSRLIYPEKSTISKTTTPDAVFYEVPPGARHQFGKNADDSMVLEEPFRLVLPPQSNLKIDKKKGGFVLPKNARRIVPGSSWGTFTIACTIPIALFVGLYMYRFRKGKVVEASFIGAIMVLAATVAGASIPGSQYEQYFSLSRDHTIYAIAAYGFIASVLPVWLLLCPRDYLSSFLKIGTIALLVVGVIVANPKFEAPAINHVFAGGGGPMFKGAIFPYVFICIMCGAISGFHALVASGTTPKMIDKESNIRMIGYGAMLMEGLVGVVALIAAAALPNSMYYDINIDLSKRPEYSQALKALDADHAEHAGPSELVEMEKDVKETLRGRTGGAVTLAVGMARILTKAMPSLHWLRKYWYHFAIMFEALFILTTIDTGTRIGRFLLQETLGKLYKPLGDLDKPLPAIAATAVIVFAWAYFIKTGSVETIWPMFGMANQLLSVLALAVVTTVLVRSGKKKYAFVTALPMLFVASTTTSAAYHEIADRYVPWLRDPATYLKGCLNIALTAMLLICVAIIVAAAARKCLAGKS